MRDFKVETITALLVVLLFGVIAGVIFLIYQLEENAKVAMSQWPTVQGTILSSRVVEYTDSDGKEWRSRYVRFAYEVNDIPYSAEQQLRGAWVGEDSRYPNGKTVIVYYDAAKPEMAVIEPMKVSLAWKSWAIIALFVFFAVGCMLIVRWGRKQK